MSDPLRIDLSDFGPAKAPSSVSTSDPAVRTGSVWRRLRWIAVLALPAAIVPFLLLLRGSVHAHARWGYGPWPAVATGIVFATAALALILWTALAVLRFPRGFRKVLSRGAAGLALVFVIHGLLYVGLRNVKGDAVQAEYRSLHPLLRLGSTVLVLVDRDAVMTDASRIPEDYAAMGLPEARASLHFPQSDGYAHALDLRTAGRPEWRNVLVEAGFRMMGFRTLRHVGSADHLHVSLPPRGPATP
ncbi:MAG TPA: hypothetical protein VK858_09875 [Longimicrobiales bacterium]|nr:hypothetical protein [Longimicrobiales bacterium]